MNNWILHIETATKKCSVALAKNGELIVLREILEEKFNHAEKLHVLFEELFQEAQISWKELSAISVSKGPGSYTGLRIGVSSAKGLCYALNIPLISVNTLEIIARQLQVAEGEQIVSMIDARRMEVFAAIYDNQYNEIKPTYAWIVEENPFSEGIYHLVGDGAMKCQNILKGENIHYYLEIQHPSAKEMVQISYQKYLNKIFEDVAYFEPFYLKDFHLTQKP
ncbi:tRNA (adenosine(37)-N6)-threonylcarbamoyltransferase complex dimerization subunit type 1 TsaB [Capnocytophaga sp. ARDL2]|uniref:tRNA (adenosine(37)-N6)-threonylcarbamoyltransferase complex dimerization subunit type 1 TsaB n=1 Tax=Capnocytophaga sp. ARDL2 TaxID=3238809 RepID=UPI0035576061